MDQPNTRPVWRLIITGVSAGPQQMATDEAILEAVVAGRALPTLRLYAWDPPCLSLGYAQPFREADLQKLSDRGWGLVRRPTGGRAILHTDELTYAVIAPADNPLVSGGVLKSYQRLAGALLASLRLIEVPASAKAEKDLDSQKSPDGPVCFEVPSQWEITVAGKKIIGSAQLRRKNGVLQHGTLPLTGDLTRITQALTFPDENTRRAAGESLLQRATTIEAALGDRVPWQDAANAFVGGFEKSLGLRLMKGELNQWERDRAATLEKDRYANEDWTERR